MRPATLTTAATICLTGWAGCTRSPVNMPPYNPSAAGRQAMTQLDTDHSGALDRNEASKSPGLLAAFASFDADANEEITEKEIASRIAAYRQEQVALMPFRMTITFDGQPLAGALVTLTPEPFLSYLLPAVGTTDKEGGTLLSVEGLAAKGVQAGIYRVNISKKNASGQETLPERYNSHTTLGQELASDLRDLERGAAISLTSQ